jgi:hypothetical protein
MVPSLLAITYEALCKEDPKLQVDNELIAVSLLHYSRLESTKTHRILCFYFHLRVYSFMSLLFSDEELNHDRFDGNDKLYIKIINQFSQHLQDYGSGL